MSPVRGILNLIKNHSYSQPRPFLSHTHMDFPLLVHFSGKGFVWIILLGNLWEPFQLPVWVFFFSFLFFGHMARGVLVPQPGLESMLPAREAQSWPLDRLGSPVGFFLLFFFQFESYDHEADIQLSQNSLFFIFFFHFYTIFKVTFHVQLFKILALFPMLYNTPLSLSKTQ